MAVRRLTKSSQGDMIWKTISSSVKKKKKQDWIDLNEFEKAIPFLNQYKGKKGKWNNSDYYQLGFSYYQQKDYEEALIWFTKIIDGNNTHHMIEASFKALAKSIKQAIQITGTELPSTKGIL